MNFNSEQDMQKGCFNCPRSLQHYEALSIASSRYRREVAATQGPSVAQYLTRPHVFAVPGLYLVVAPPLFVVYAVPTVSHCHPRPEAQRVALRPLKWSQHSTFGYFVQR